MEKYKSFSTTFIQKYLSSAGTYYVYEKILSNIQSNSSILDIGCGDGIYFTNPKVINVIKKKNLKIHCIDIDSGAINILNERIQQCKLSDNVSCKCIDLFNIKEKYDYTFYIESFPVIPRDIFKSMLCHSSKITNKQTFLYHNLVEEKSSIREFIRSNLKYILNIDFGIETTINEMNSILKSQDYQFMLDVFIETLFFKQYLIKINNNYIIN